MSSIWGARGLTLVEACGRTWFAQVSLEFVEVMRTLLVLRSLCRNTQDIEEALMSCVNSNCQLALQPMSQKWSHKVRDWGSQLGDVGTQLGRCVAQPGGG